MEYDKFVVWKGAKFETRRVRFVYEFAKEGASEEQSIVSRYGSDMSFTCRSSLKFRPKRSGSGGTHLKMADRPRLLFFDYTTTDSLRDHNQLQTALPRPT